jgi:hypothetical protein
MSKDRTLNSSKPKRDKKQSNSFLEGTIAWNSILIAICTLVLAFYIWTAGSNGVPLIVDIGPEEYFKQVPTPCLFPDISPHHYGFYNLMADAYSVGRADLLLDPPKELLELKNPIDPEQNALWRILDLSLHNGRYYLYFGPVPTLTLFIPFRWLGIGKISEPLATVFYCYGLFLCSTFILLRCVKSYIPNCNRWLLIFAILGLGLSNTSPYLLRHPTVYEVAIAAGAFFSMLGLCFLLTAWQRWRPQHAGAHRDAATGKLSLPMLSAASLCFGLAFGCRLTYLFTGIFLFLLWLAFFWKQGLFNSESLKSGLAMAVPFAICIAAIAWFNYIRFGSPGDFGIEKQMNATLWDFGAANRLCNILPGLFLRAVCPPQITDVFPFIRLHQFYPFDLPKGYHLEEVSGGFLATSPIVLLFLLLAVFWVKSRLRDHLVHICLALIFVGTVILITESFMMFSNSMRYQLDFAPPILLGSVIGILAMNKSWATGGRIFQFFPLSLLGVGIVSHIMISLTGFRDTLRRGEPSMYFALEDAMRPISRLMHPWFESNKINLLDMTPQLGAVRFSDGSEGYPISKDGLHIRLYAPPEIQLQLSGNILTIDSEKPKFLKFRSSSGEFDHSEIKSSSFHQWVFKTEAGSNRVDILVQADDENALYSRRPLAYLKNLSISGVNKN